MFCINAWLINSRNSNVNTFATDFIARLPQLKASGVTHVRIGGIMPNWDQLYSYDPNNLAIITASVTRLESLITEIRKAGMEPIIQVGVAPPQWPAIAGCSTFTSQSGVNSLGNLSIAQQATVAANLVY